MNVSTIKKSATKGLMIFGFSALGFFLLASAAKRWQIARTAQNLIATGK
jgi:hypothetical protein